MPRKPRVHFDGAFYHVTFRGNNKNKIFFDDNDRKYFIGLLNLAVKKFSCKVHAFCLMTNHVHMLIEVSQITLSKIMHDIEFRYANWINKKTGRIGHLLQGRYYAKCILSDEYLLQVLRYIHLNPLEAKITTNLHEYIWSSHLNYLGLKKHDWVTISFLLSMLSQDKDKQLILYEKFIIHSEINEKNNEVSICVFENLDVLTDYICKLYNIEKNLFLLTKKDSSEKKEIRSIISVLALRLKLANKISLSKYFSRSPSAITKLLQSPTTITLTDQINTLEEMFITNAD